MIISSSTDYFISLRFPDWGPSIPSLLNYIHEGTEWAGHRPHLKNDGSHHWIPHWVVCFDCMCRSGCCEGDNTSLCTAWHRQWHGISQCLVRSVTAMSEVGVSPSGDGQGSWMLWPEIRRTGWARCYNWEADSFYQKWKWNFSLATRFPMTCPILSYTGLTLPVTNEDQDAIGRGKGGWWMSGSLPSDGCDAYCGAYWQHCSSGDLR